jgi:hypothetical protein
MYKLSDYILEFNKNFNSRIKPFLSNEIREEIEEMKYVTITYSEDKIYLKVKGVYDITYIKNLTNLEKL